MFISKYKNGIQYLDSFGWSNTNDDSRYISCKGYLTLRKQAGKLGISMPRGSLQEGMFNPALDKKVNE